MCIDHILCIICLTLVPPKSDQQHFLQTVSLLNQTLRSWGWGNYLQLKKLDCKTNSPCQYHWKCLENSVENMHTDVRVYRVKSLLKWRRCNWICCEQIKSKRSKDKIEIQLSHTNTPFLTLSCSQVLPLSEFSLRHIYIVK